MTDFEKLTRQRPHLEPQPEPLIAPLAEPLNQQETQEDEPLVRDMLSPEQQADLSRYYEEEERAVRRSLLLGGNATPEDFEKVDEAYRIAPLSAAGFKRVMGRKEMDTVVNQLRKHPGVWQAFANDPELYAYGQSDVDLLLDLAQIHEAVEREKKTADAMRSTSNLSDLFGMPGLMRSSYYSAQPPAQGPFDTFPAMQNLHALKTWNTSNPMVKQLEIDGHRTAPPEVLERMEQRVALEFGKWQSALRGAYIDEPPEYHKSVQDYLDGKITRED